MKGVAVVCHTVPTNVRMFKGLTLAIVSLSVSDTLTRLNRMGTKAGHWQ